jgi:cytochrome c oxidase subunit 2
MFVDEDEDVVVSNYMHTISIGKQDIGDDNVLGKANVRYIEGANVVGVDLADPYAQDDFVVTGIFQSKNSL